MPGAGSHTLHTTVVREGQLLFVRFPSALLGCEGRVRVKGTLNGHPFATSAEPWSDGQHVITLNAGMERRMKAGEGDDVALTLQLDDVGQRELELPADLLGALRSAGAQDAFDELPSDHQSRFLGWIASAKSEPERQGRVLEAVRRVLAKEHPFADLRGTTR